MRAAHVELAARWLERLHALLPVPLTAVFPSASLLDHIPDLIEHLADDIASNADQALVANTAVIAKAQELGELRYGQQASVHQLLREYRLLAEVLSGFIAEKTKGLEAHAAEAFAASARLHEGVFVLMQTTVDTFVARYAETVKRQTTRLEGFNRMVTHELRQPLGTVRSAVDVLKHESAPAEARARCIELIETNTRRMASLTTRLLALSSLEVDSLQTQEVELSRLVEDAASQLAETAARQGVELRLAVPPVRLTTDPARVELVLINLISNAIKYADPSKPTRFVEIAGAEDAERIRLTVSDNGIGIPEAHLDRVFDGFHRAHAARDKELGAEGIGLGLAIVAECVRHLGATIRLDSTEGAGTTAHLRFPSRSAVSPLVPPARSASAPVPDA